ncbi:hypothetical protein D3C75_664540 [compost metagenome]
MRRAIQPPMIQFSGLACRPGPPTAMMHAELGHHPAGGQVARHVAGGQGRQAQLLEGKGPDQQRRPGGQPAVLPGHAHPPGQLAVPVQGDDPEQRGQLITGGQCQGPGPPQPEGGLAPAHGERVAGRLQWIRMGDVEGVAGKRLIRAITHYVGLILRPQWSQH